MSNNPVPTAEKRRDREERRRSLRHWRIGVAFSLAGAVAGIVATLVAGYIWRPEAPLKLSSDQHSVSLAISKTARNTTAIRLNPQARVLRLDFEPDARASADVGLVTCSPDDWQWVSVGPIESHYVEVAGGVSHVTLQLTPPQSCVRLRARLVRSESSIEQGFLVESA